MDRRHFIRMSALGASAGLIVPATALAGTASMAGGVYYTKDAPGRWSAKAGPHLPVVEVSGKSIQVTTPHEMKGYEHYIVKHMVLNDKYEFITEKMFNPDTDQTAVSQFTLDNYSGQIYVLSVCNKHDTWMSSATV